MVGVREAFTEGLISSQVALSYSHYLSQGIKMDQLATHTRDCRDRLMESKRNFLN